MADQAAAAQVAALNALFDALKGATLIAYADGASVTVYTYDYLLTLGMEIELVWKSQWSWVKVLFLVQRYMPFFDTAFLTVYNRWASNLSVPECGRLSFGFGYLYLIGMSFSEIILTIRVWALWNRDRRMTILLPIAFILITIPSFTVMYYFSKSVVYAPAPYPGYKGCFAVGAKRYVVWCWSLLLLWNTTTLILMLIPAITSYRSGLLGVRSNLNRLVYRDGVLYYIYLFAFSTINIITSITQPPATRTIITAMERCLHSLFASRVLLHMRDHGRKVREGSRPQFASFEGVGFSDSMHMESRGKGGVIV